MSQPSNGISIVYAVLARAYMCPTHRHTDHATCDICSNRRHRMHCILFFYPGT